MVNGSRATVPIDLVAIAALCGFVIFFSILDVVPPSIRIPLGFVFVLVAPGYALASALFPRGGSTDNKPNFSTDRNGEPTRITFVERLVLSVGLSIAVVPLVGVLVSYTQWGFDPTAVTIAIVCLTVTAAIVGTIRRWMIPIDQRFEVPVASAPTRLAAFLGEPETDREETLALVIILGLVVSTTGIGFAATVPGNGERFTEFYIQAQNPESGDFEPDAYPDEWAVDEPVDVFVGVTNQEGQTVNYTIVAQQQQLSSTNGRYQITAITELDRLEVTVDAGESWGERLEVTPTESSDGTRIAYLLYVGEPPDNPTAETAYRTVYLSADGDTDETELRLNDTPSR